MVQLQIDHIVSDPEMRRGKPHIKGTGITVQNVVEDLANGHPVTYLVEQFDLTLGQIYAALSYYYDHQAEIDAAIESDRVALQALIESPEYQTSQQRIAEIRAKLDSLKGRHTG